MAERLMASDPRGGERGFTIIEVLIALVVLLLGMAGILSLQLTSVEATAFSRHATEASILGEDRMEGLRTQPLAPLIPICSVDPPPSQCTDRVDARGRPDPDGLYLREWIVSGGSPATVTVRVSWLEQGGEPYSMTFSTQRKP